ncbi:hydantoinase B/oxoprolinase family protein [Herbiconiux sp. P15]|uniref:hydantoinase B/oxoprolinase family protein n=1 Tax=Herbiconiux liukaitaii TaxID=3342799 RepID=UPI0035B7860C
MTNLTEAGTGVDAAPSTTAPSTTSPGAAAQIDGVRLAVINNRLEGVVGAMMNTLLRTARSAVMNTARDFSCGILTAGDEVLTVAESLPSHSFRGPDLQARWMKEFHPDLKAGDAFANNSPYHGNSHAADWCILMPVVDADGVHRYTVFAKAHVADAGNSIPTTFMSTAIDVYNEGALIFPGTKIQSDYEINQDFVRMCRVRLRAPETWYGDFLAILAAARIGERRLLELLAELGPDDLDSFEQEWFDYSEQRMISALKELPAGRVEVDLRHDAVEGAPDGIPVHVDLMVDPVEARVVIDLRDNIDCMPIGLNLTEATAIGNSMAGVFSSLKTQVPTNAGSFRRVEVLLRENCMIGIPRHPFSCSLATTNLAETLGKAVTLAISQLGDGFGLAEIGKVLPPAMGVISGYDPREGHKGPFVNFLSLLVTNGAGAPQEDGWLTTIGIGVAGLQLHDSVEVDEMKYPIEVLAQELITDSEGAGRFRGAPGARVEYGPVGTDLEVIYTSDGSATAPVGARGGHAGSVADQLKREHDGTLTQLPPQAQVHLEAGEYIISIGTGGGGYGDPLERDPARVAKDVSAGYVSPGRARDTYGVVLDEAFEVDEAATAALRGELMAAQP